MLATVLCLCACLLAVHAQDIVVNEEQACKQQGLEQRTCKALSQCPKAQEGLRNGKKPEICRFAGPEPLVCCHTNLKPLASAILQAAPKPQTSPRPRTTSITQGRTSEETLKGSSKSKENCKEYAKSVFMKDEDPIDGKEVSRDTCVNVDQLIAGEDPIYAQPRQYPHMALIGYGDKNNIGWLCGGSLISQRFVLSAAHCTDAELRGLARWVRLGDYDIASKRDDDDGSAGSREYEIIERINHPLYKKPSLYNDIALYKLITDMQFNEFIRPICLHTEPQNTGTSVVYSAWGETRRGKQQRKILKQINFVTTETKECNDSYKTLSSKNLTNGIVEETMLCATRQNEKDSCRETDSGGPLQVRLRDPYCMYSVVGVKSFSRPCVPNSPEVYTRVSYYVPWIEGIVWP